MALPAKLKQFVIFVDGTSMIGIAEEITLPKLTRKTQAWRGGGMLAAVDVDLGFEDGALDMEITVGGISTFLLGKMGTETADGMQLRFAGAYQDDSTAGIVPCEIQVRGRFTETDWGNAKVGDDTSHKYTLKNTYCKISVNGAEVLEVDALNFIHKVNGVDKAAAMRQALGL